MKSSYLFVAIAIILVAAGAVFALTTSQSTQSDSRTVAATIGPVASLTEQIAGEHFEVVQILPAGASPHTYSLKVSDAEALESASLVFAIGNGLDDWVTDSVDESKLVDLDQGIELMEYGEEGHHHDDEDHEDEDHEGEEHEDEEHMDEHEEDDHMEGEDHEEENHDHDHEGADPHYWLSAQNASIMAETITDELIAKAPELEDELRSNLAKLQISLRGLLDDSKTKIAAIDDPEIITVHSAFGYMADELGIEVVATVEESPGKEPTAAYIKELGDVITEENVRVLFKEPQMSDAIIEPLANDYGAKVGILDPLGTDSESYQELYQRNVQVIVDAFAN